jgi:hypothetical protein
MRCRLILSVFVLVLACAPKGLDPGVAGSIEQRLSVPAGDARASQYAQAVALAHSMVADFARKNGWEREASVRTFDAVEVFDDGDLIWRRMLELNRAPLDTPKPTATLAAGIEGRVLLAVTPELYEKQQPAYAAKPQSWARLLAHEMVHRMHVAIVGVEDNMGPQWFFEGFAVVGSGQNFDDGIVYHSSAEALE